MKTRQIFATCIAVLIPMLITAPALTQDAERLRTTSTVTVHSGPNAAFGAVTTLDPNVQVTIIPPKSVVIGKGVSIGKGVLIEGKPWINVQLPDGRTGYVEGSALCTKVSGTSVQVGLCPPQ